MQCGHRRARPPAPALPRRLGLYPLLVVSFGLLAFGLAAVLGESGFLAVYLAGIVLGNGPVVFRRGIWLFHDAAAWLAQIVLLGLLSFPSRLAAVAGEGLVIALALIFVARPLAGAASALPFGFRLREGRVPGLGRARGAVPITLATSPMMAGVPGSQAIFDAAFFVVLVPVVTQGWSLPAVALRHVDGEIVDYTVAPSARVAGRLLRELALPDGVAVALVVRGAEVVVPRGATALRPGDHVFVAVHDRLRPLVDALFDPDSPGAPARPRPGGLSRRGPHDRPTPLLFRGPRPSGDGPGRAGRAGR